MERGRPVAPVTELKDRVFGRLTARYRLGMAKDGSGAVWRCQCECGRWVKIRRSSLLNGSTKSCGCLSRDYQRWQGEDGIAEVMERFNTAIEETTYDTLAAEYETGLRLTGMLAKKFGTVMIGRAVRELRRESSVSILPSSPDPDI